MSKVRSLTFDTFILTRHHWFCFLKEPENEERPSHSKQLSQLTADQKVHLLNRIVNQQESGARTRHSRSRHNENLTPADKKGDTISRRSRKRRSTEKMGATVVSSLCISFIAFSNKILGNID